MPARAPASFHTLLQWLLAVVAVYALLSFGALAASEQFSQTVSDTPPAVIGQFLLLATAAFALRACRWCFLKKILGAGGGMKTAAQIYIGGFPMTLTPGRAGEVWRAWALHQQCGVPYRQGVSLILCDRLLDLIALLLFAAGGLFAAVSAYYFSAAAVFCIFFPLLFLLFFPRRCRRLIKGAWQASGRRAPRVFASLLAVYRLLGAITRRAVFFPLVALSLAAWGLEAAAIYNAMQQLGGVLSLGGAAATLGLGNIAGVASFLPGGIGGQEAAMIYLLVQNGNALVLAAAVIGITRVCTLFYAALLGLPFFLHYSRRGGGAEVKAAGAKGAGAAAR